MTAAGYINAERRRDKLKKSGMGESVKLLILKNLEKEVHKYGYHWSWKSHVLLTAGALLGICAIGLVFQLRMEYLAVIVIVTLFLLPVFVIDVFHGADAVFLSEIGKDPDRPKGNAGAF